MESILSQKGRFELEVLVEDSESSDTTPMILERFIPAFRSKGIAYTINSQADNNMYEAVVRGFNKAQGDIITWISGTDFYLPNAFSTVVDIFGNLEEVNWITGVPMSFNDKGQNFYTKLPIAYHSDLIKQGFYNGKFLHFIQQESCFMRKSCLDSIAYSEMVNFPHAGDQKLWNLLADVAQLYIVNTYLSGSRMHDNRVSSNVEYQEEFKTIRSKPNISGRFNAVLQYLATHFFPEKLKRMLAKNLLEYRNGSWNL